MEGFKKSIGFLFLVLLSQLPSMAQDTLKTQQIDTLQPVHSPRKAALMSAVLPGLGQVYNKKVWKVPVLYAGLGTNIYFLARYVNLYREYRNCYVDYVNFKGDPIKYNEPVFPDNRYVTDASDKQTALKFYKDQYQRLRDLNILIMAGIYFINIIDATVDAYLFYYDIGDNLSLRVEPVIINTIAYRSAAGLKFTFNIH